jgi:hypothetical protein
VRDKLQLTRQLVDQLPDHGWTFEQARVSWWVNIRNTGGMRLTDQGYRVLVQDLGLEYYEFDIPDKTKFTQRTVLALDRKLQMPYYIKSQKQKVVKLTFFGSQEAVLANLYGDLEKFLDNYC